MPPSTRQKRRLDDAAHEDEPEVKRIEGLWFSNDTLVLRAGNSAFRVTKSILAARSTVFETMLEFPQPPLLAPDEETIDGCPAVVLHDRPHEVEPFLRAIFDSSYFMPPPAKVDFNVVLGILRLSHKYDINYLYQRALLHLETVYSTDLPSFRRHRESNNLKYDRRFVAPDLKAIRILHEVGAVWLLPLAYYSIGTFQARTLLGAGRAWDVLPVEMKLRCTMLQAHHLRATNKVHALFLDRGKCTTASCAKNKDMYLELLLQDADEDEGLDPLYEWETSNWGELREELCSRCFARAQRRYEAAVSAIWDALPGNCGVQDWDVLREKRRLSVA
ncbi:hypothetical protein C8R43DRAFT_1239368 [Mycena crocata]|nr:hypothetical protein C8R43DRAFT_1239368 [Mycena crocata]